MRAIVMDQKFHEAAEPITPIVQTESPTPISRNGLILQNIIKKIKDSYRNKLMRATTNQTFGR